MKRVILKISGEALSGKGGVGFDKDALDFLTTEINDAVQSGVQLGIMVGGGNYIRGAQLNKKLGTTKEVGDLGGMISSVINALVLKDHLERLHNLNVAIASIFPVSDWVEVYDQTKVTAYLDRSTIVIFCGGTGKPGVTHDTGMVVRASELGADLVLKATKVDGVYDKDPNQHDDATFIKQLTYAQALEQQLGILDMSAIELAQEHTIAIHVFDGFVKGNLAKVIAGEDIGSLITSKK